LEVILLVTLVLRNGVRAVTFTVKVHPPAGASVAPVRLMLFDPATAEIVPPQEPLNPFGVATASPDGRVSLKPTPVNPDAVEFVRLNVRLVVPFSGTVGGLLKSNELGPPNDLMSVSGSSAT